MARSTPARRGLARVSACHGGSTVSLNVHELGGCRPDPLAHYFKALGVLRLVAEQRDRDARGLWRNDVFLLVTSLDRSELEGFFADDYSPTPIVAPWNGGSGFYPKDNRQGMDAIRSSKGVRFERYRHAIKGAEQVVAGRPKSPKDDDKKAMLSACVRSLGEDAYRWISAAVALDRNGNGRYPALLGSGGNDGRLDFTNNFMQRLVELLDPDANGRRAEAIGLLNLALFGGARSGLVDRAIGQFFPGAAGGANGTAGFEASATMNPWDFVLMLEGAVMMRVASLRRLDGSDLAQAAAPFALRNTTEGYGSAAESDASARGEQWLPLWGRPASVVEVAHLFAEAKLASGRGAAQSALEAAQAIGRLGAARGVASFRRFSFMERNGQANLAVPLGSLSVAEAPRARLLDEIDAWLDAFRRAARGDHAPKSFQADLRGIEGAAFACTDAGAGPEAWQRLVIGLGEAERGMVGRPKATFAAHLRPLPNLSSGWLEAVDDGRAETRVAIAIASARAPRVRTAVDLGPIRMHGAPLLPSLSAFRTTSETLAHDPDVVWAGRSLVDDLAACVVRRALRAGPAGYRIFPLAGTAHASLDDVAAFLDGRLDDGRISQLARGLMAVEFVEHNRVPAWAPVPGELATYAVFRTLYSPLDEGAGRAANPMALRQLLAGRLDGAVRTASSQLVARGLRPKLHVVVGSPGAARRIAAALAIPIASRDQKVLRRFVSRPFDASQENSP
ncbi:MAG: type I-G CRISPR-associated protein Cas8g1/Csx17 [Polyangiaceae bacterium]